MMMIGLLPLILILFWSDAFRAFARRDHRDEESGPVESRASSVSVDGSRLDGVIFRLAKRSGGVLTVSSVVVETGMTLRTAEAYMDSLVDGVRVAAEYDVSGRSRYLFRELIDEMPELPGNGDS